MNQYKKIFGTSRIPGKKADTLIHQYPTKSTHIIVCARNRLYKVEVMGSGNVRVPLLEIERMLLAVGALSLESTSRETPMEIGALTAGHRDNWYEAHTHLSFLSTKNSEQLQTINTALFVVCLDDQGVKANKDLSHLKIFHNHDASNRWFDKSIQIIVSSSGRAGLNGEVYFEFIVAYPI